METFKLKKLFAVSLTALMSSGTVAGMTAVAASAEEASDVTATYTSSSNGQIIMLIDDDYAAPSIYTDSDGEHGTVSGISRSSMVKYEISADEGYVIDTVYINGKKQDDMSGGTYAEYSVGGASSNVTATFKKSSGNNGGSTYVADDPDEDETYSINTSCSAGGTITGGGQNLDASGEYDITITANDGYSLRSVTVDGKTETKKDGTTGASIHYSGLDASHTIHAEFVKDNVKNYKVGWTKNEGGTVTMDVTAKGTQGTVSGDGKTSYYHNGVGQGTNVTFNVTANDGYVIASADVGGSAISKAVGKTGMTQTFTGIDSDKVLNVRFRKTSTDNTSTTVRISTSAGYGGKITPSSTVKKGTNVTVTASANSGYYVKQVKVDGKTAKSNASAPDEQSVTFPSVQTNHSVSAVFAKNGSTSTATKTKYYKISTKAGKGGKITASSTVKAGSSKTIKFSASKGYRIATFKIDGKSKSTKALDDSGSVTFSKIAGNHSVEVTFKSEKSLFKITYKKPAAPSLAVKAGKKSVYAKWSKPKYADKYELAYRMKGSGKWYRIKTKKNSVTVKKLSSKKQYYFTVRAANVNRYSSYAKTKLVKVK